MTVLKATAARGLELHRSVISMRGKDKADAKKPDALLLKMTEIANLMRLLAQLAAHDVSSPPPFHVLV